MIDNLSEILYTLFYTLLGNIGKYGPIILILFSLVLLRRKQNLLFYYSIGVFLNSIMNLILKGIFKQPRPTENIKDFNLAIKNGRHYIFKDGHIPFNIYGMPSGHAQSAFFSAVFIYLALKNIKILGFYLIILLITIYQRAHDKYHTFAQIVVGSLIGACFSYYVYFLSKENIKGLIREKPDDNGPI
jgi:membrane-associated phospholipid phosphatase